MVRNPSNSDAWSMAQDGEGKQYYVNSVTGETSWTMPQAMGFSQSNPMPTAHAMSEASFGKLLYEIVDEPKGGKCLKVSCVGLPRIRMTL